MLFVYLLVPIGLEVLCWFKVLSMFLEFGAFFENLNELEFWYKELFLFPFWLLLMFFMWVDAILEDCREVLLELLFLACWVALE